jgi:type II secretion system protein J
MHSNKTALASAREKSGFTLVEVVLAVAIMGLMLAGVYAVAKASVVMSEEISTSQESAMKTQSLIDLLRRTFEQTPGNTQIELKLTEPGNIGTSLSDLALKDYPLAFSWAGVEAGAKMVIIRLEKDPRGAMQMRVLYLNKEQAEDYEANKLSTRAEVANLLLLDQIQKCQWSFYDERADEWVDSWDKQKYGTRRPSQVNLFLQFFDGNPPQNLVYWIPTMANPETFTQNGGNGGNGNGGNGGGMNPDPNNPGVSIPNGELPAPTTPPIQ